MPRAKGSISVAEEKIDAVFGEAPDVPAPDPAPGPATTGASPGYTRHTVPGLPRQIELPSNLSPAQVAQAISVILQSAAAKELIARDTGVYDDLFGEAPGEHTPGPPPGPAPGPPAFARVQAGGGEYTSYTLPGFPQPIELPSNLSDEQVAQAISVILQTPDSKAFIDQDTGAPAFVRAQAGGGPAQDRLANIRRLGLPDAEPYGDDNFIFTHPDTGRLTLYNDRAGGFPFVSWGDVASVSREAAVATGAGLGAAFGFAGGLTYGPGAIAASPTMAALGAGGGGAVGGELFDIYSNVFLSRVDTRSVFERSVDAGTEFFLSASGQRGGELLAEGAKRAFGGGGRKAMLLVEKFRSLRIEPTAGAVSSSNTVATLEKALEASPFSGDIIQKQARRVLKEITQAADSLVAKFGTAVSAAEMGAGIRAAVKNAAGRFSAAQNAAYKRAFDLIGDDAPVALDAVRALRERLEARLRAAPRSLAGSLGTAINTLKMYELDHAAGKMTFSALRDIRSTLGKNLDEPLLSGSTGSQNATMRLVYGALTEDMSAVAKYAGPKAQRALAVADRYTRAWMKTAGELLDKIGKFDTDEQAYRYAMSRLGDGGTRLRRLRSQFEPEEWDTVAASVLDKMGLARASGQDAAGEVFSPDSFVNSWVKMSDEAKDALFGGTRYAELSRELTTLVEAASSLRGAEKLANTSNTARVMIAYMTLTGLGAGLAEMGTSGGGGGTLAGVLALGFLSRRSAKLITSPKFIKWLTTPITNPNGIGAHFGRLTAIAAEDPALKEPIEAFLQALRSPPQPKE